jgi:hypothetical protein
MLTPTTFRQFAELTVRLRGKPFSLADRPYLHDVYDSTARRLVLRCSRQVEKSTLLCNHIIHNALRIPERQFLYVCPRQEQAQVFSRTRLRPTIEQSPVLRKLLWRKKRPMPVSEITFDNGSRVFIRAAFNSADANRGVSADELLVDEYQDMAPNSLAVLNETLSHSPQPMTIVAGTPKWIENHLETAFLESTAKTWQVACPGCGQLTALNEKTLGLEYLASPCCQARLDPRQGRWISRNPDSTYADGFQINHLMVPWMTIPDILERQGSYDRVQFLNEVLGLPSSLGDHVVTREEMEACCEPRAFVENWQDIDAGHRPLVVLGIDWGGGAKSGTVAVTGYSHRDRRFRVLRCDRWPPHEEPNHIVQHLGALCVRLGVRWIAADDNGLGSVYNCIVIENLKAQGHALRGFYGMLYAADTESPKPHGAVIRWNIGRTPTIGGMFGRIKLKLLLFPQASQSGSFLDDFVNVVGEFDDTNRVLRYTKPDDRQDDCVHATNYAELLAMRVWAGQQR